MSAAPPQSPTAEASPAAPRAPPAAPAPNFLRTIIADDNDRNGGRRYRSCPTRHLHRAWKSIGSTGLPPRTAHVPSSLRRHESAWARTSSSRTRSPNPSAGWATTGATATTRRITTTRSPLAEWFIEQARVCRQPDGREMRRVNATEPGPRAPTAIARSPRISNSSAGCAQAGFDGARTAQDRHGEPERISGPDHQDTPASHHRTGEVVRLSATTNAAQRCADGSYRSARSSSRPSPAHDWIIEGCRRRQPERAAAAIRICAPRSHNVALKRRWSS